MKTVIRDSSELKIDEHNKYYKHEFHCSNCGKINTIYIIKGKPIKDCVMEPCENCGVYQEF